MNNGNLNNIIISVLHLKEVSELLENIEPEISYAMLELSKKILLAHKIDNNDVNKSIEIANQISGNDEISCSNELSNNVK